MVDYIKRIQSSISSKKRVTRDEIREYLESKSYDTNLLTKEQIDEAKNYFLGNLDSSISSICVSDSEVELSEIEVFESKTLSDEIQATVLQDTSILNDEQPEQSAPLLFNPEVKSMVDFKAQSMGLQLAENQIEVIAESIDSNGNSFQQTIQDIESALITYIDYQQSQESEQIEGMMSRVADKYSRKNQLVSAQLNTSIVNFKSALEVAESERKTVAKNILSRLAINK